MKVDRKALISVLSAVKPAVSEREVVEQSNAFIFYEGRVYTYNDEIAVSHPTEVSFNCAVKAKELVALLDKLADDEIDIEVKGSELRVSGKKSQAGINLQTEINMDLLTAIGKPDGDWNELPEDFVTGVSFCMFSVCHDLNTPMLTCVNVSGNEVFSTDKLRITQYRMKSDLPDGGIMNIPIAAAKELKNYKPTEYVQTDGWIHFKTKEEVIFSTRVMEGDFPTERARAYLDGVERKEVIKLPSDLSDCLTRAGIFSSAGSQTMDRIKLELGDNELTISSKGHSGWFTETARVRYSGKPVMFEVNHGLLKDILSFTDEMLVGEKLLKFEGESFSHGISILG